MQLQLRPLVHFRPHDAPVDSPHPGPYRFTAWGDRYEVSVAGPMPPLRMMLVRPGAGVHPRRRADDRDRVPARGAARIPVPRRPVEPGFLPRRAGGRQPAVLVASAESWETMRAMSFDEALRAERQRRSRALKSRTPDPSGDDALPRRAGPGRRRIPDQAGRPRRGRRPRQAAGEDIRTVIAGYHWFTDWGRDTMISLEGLTLTPAAPPRPSSSCGRSPTTSATA